MKILYINVIEQNAGWGAEYFINRALLNQGHDVINLDYRKYRDRLGEKLLEIEDLDVVLLQRGDWFPIELLKAINRPKIFWASELVSRCRDQDRLLTSNQFDYVFVHSNDCKKIVTQQLQWIDENNVSVLINGFDENVQYKIKKQTKDIDLLFVGNITQRRRKMLDKLKLRFNILESQVFGEDMTKLFNRAKIILNIHAEEFLDTETRIFEALACGAFVISEKLSSENPFISGEHYIEVLIDKTEELENQIAYYLDNELERERISKQGYEEAIKYHTYSERAKYIASILDSQRESANINNIPAIDKKKVKAYINSNLKIYDIPYYIESNYTNKIIFEIINRIEKGVFLQQDIEQLFDILNQFKININDLVMIIISRSIKKEQVLNLVASKFYEVDNVEYALTLLSAAFELNYNNLETIYIIADILCQMKQYELALQYLLRFSGKDVQVDQKIEEIQKYLEDSNKVYSFNYLKKKVKFFLPNLNDHIQKLIYNNRTFYELMMLEDIRKRCNGSSIILDVGANIGNHSIYFGIMCDCKKVYSFEPQLNLFDILNKNVTINNLQNKVIPKNKAIGRHKSWGMMGEIINENLGCTNIIDKGVGNVEIDTIDNVLKEEDLPVDIIKIDVEGMEKDVLVGAEKTIEKYKPIIYIEAHSNEFNEILNIMYRYKYRPINVFNYSPTYLFMHYDSINEVYSDEFIKNSEFYENRIMNNLQIRKQNGEICGIKEIPRVFIAVKNCNWEKAALVDPWRDMAEIIHYDWEGEYDQYSSEWYTKEKSKFNEKLYSKVYEENNKKHIDIFFSYLSGAWVYAETINKIRNLGIIVINFDFDDSLKFWNSKEKDGFTGSAEIAPFCDICVSSQSKNNLSKYTNIGANPLFLPSAVNVEIFARRPIKNNKEILVSFIGQKYGEREALIEFLRDNGIDVLVKGKGWDGGEISTEEMLNIYENSLITLGFGYIGNTKNVGLKGRDFEAAVSGAAYLTTYNEELKEFLIEDKEIIFYKDQYELLNKVKYYIENKEEAINIAYNSRKRILSEHTWEKRWRYVLELCKKAVN